MLQGFQRLDRRQGNFGTSKERRLASMAVRTIGLLLLLLISWALWLRAT